MNAMFNTNADTVVMVLFGSNDCGPCLALQQRINEYAQQKNGVTFFYMELNRTRETAAQLGILTAPSLLVYVNNQLSLRESGCFSLSAVLRKIEYYLDLLSQ